MTPSAHLGGVPVEEFLPSAAAGLIVARGWMIAHLRRTRERRDER